MISPKAEKLYHKSIDNSNDDDSDGHDGNNDGDDADEDECGDDDDENGDPYLHIP